MRNSRQSGFSLLELLVAMTIMAVLATVGFKLVKNYGNEARHLKADLLLKNVSEGIDKYYLGHGRYPELGNFTAMVEPNSPLVKESLIPANTPDKDPWGQPYEGVSTKEGYTLKCVGDPKGEYGPIVKEPGRYTDSTQQSAPANQAPAPGTPK